MNISMDISDKFDNPVIQEVLTQVANIAGRLNIQFFLVGATARDLILLYGFDIRPGRATYDVDIGVNVSSWDEYELLKKELVKSELFEQVGNKQQMRYRGETNIDLLPFGDAIGPTRKFVWPSDSDVELNVLGFDEAYNFALTVRISNNPRLDIKIASATGLVLLKILAWADRKPVGKDAIDLGILIRSYLQLGNELRLFHEHSDLLENPDFDFELAGAHVLGRDLAVICGDKLRHHIANILETELNSKGDLPLVVQSAGSSPQFVKTLEFWKAIHSELSSREASL